jgi:hypothetical protein
VICRTCNCSNRLCRATRSCSTLRGQECFQPRRFHYSHLLKQALDQLGVVHKAQGLSPRMQAAVLGQPDHLVHKLADRLGFRLMTGGNRTGGGTAERTASAACHTCHFRQDHGTAIDGDHQPPRHNTRCAGR